MMMLFSVSSLQGRDDIDQLKTFVLLALVVL